jgi:hypothetical protein
MHIVVTALHQKPKQTRIEQEEGEETGFRISQAHRSRILASSPQKNAYSENWICKMQHWT